MTGAQLMTKLSNMSFADLQKELYIHSTDEDKLIRVDGELSVANITETAKPQNLKCPECDGDMVPRNGQYGKFWGCKNYPTCRGTRDSRGMSKAEREEWKRNQDPDDDIMFPPKPQPKRWEID